MSKLIVLDGLDNTGKSTCISRMQRVLEGIKYNVHVMHLDKPPADITDPDEIVQYSKKYYLQELIQKLNKLASTSADIVLLDRGWFSEYVYGPMYRNRSKLDIVEDNLILEHILKDIFREEIIYIVFVGDVENLIKHEDGKSLSNNDEEKIRTEIDEFEEYARLSSLDDVRIYDVFNENGNFEELLPKIMKNII